jgi:hypothetical protein
MAWRDEVDRVAARMSPCAPNLLRHWRAEMDAVEQRVGKLDPVFLNPMADDGLLAFVVLASARLGDLWERQQLVDVAAAVELAHRASRHHRHVVEFGRVDQARTNSAAILAGDWAITQAAVLVAGVGPTAYRLLVRGYGATQAAQLGNVPAPAALVDAGVALGALIAGADAAAVCGLYAELELPIVRRSPAAGVLGFVLDHVTAGASSASARSSSLTRRA